MSPPAAPAAPPAVACGEVGGLSGLDPTVVHRFLAGQDTQPQPMSEADMAQELGDPFSTLLLRQHRFPGTGRAVLEALAAATPAGDSLRTTQFFVLGEGSQIRWTPQTSSLARSLRFVVACGSGSEGPDVIMSVFDPDGGDVELMAWDEEHGGFNFYRSVDENAWVWAGNSRHALTAPTKGQGHLRAHPSGSFLMKELRAPWVNWHSPDANIFDTAFAPNDPTRTHPWFVQREGAHICEAAVARPSIERWARVRFERFLGNGGGVDDPARIMEQILDTPAVNLMTSHVESGAAIAGGPRPVDLPQTFFVSSFALHETLGLAEPPSFSVPPSVYAASVQRFGFALRGTDGKAHGVDTHFAFVVPERAFEDDVVLRAALDVGLLTPRFAAALLMVDFPNPLYSERRKALLKHVPAAAAIANRASGFSDEMANQILAAAQGAPGGEAEQEFAELWEAVKDLGEDDWRAVFDANLNAYYAAVTAQLATQAGFDAYVQLAESRRNRVRATPLFENPLLLPDTTITAVERTMQADGTVVES